jgi:Neuraminidase (sialidase)
MSSIASCAATIVLAACILGTACAGRDWYWPEPRARQNAVILRADGGRLLQNPDIRMLDNGDLVVMAAHNIYASDAVVSDISIEWSVSHDGGATWEAGASVPSLSPPIAGNYPRPPARLKDGTLIAVVPRHWENFDDTPAQRKELADQGYYLFTPEEGNAPGVISISRRAWMARSRDSGKTWESTDITLPTFMPHFCCYGDGIVLRDGTFVQPMWGRFDLRKEPKYISSLALRTEDGGEHWDLRTIAKAKDFDFNETSITEAANGDLVALMRTSMQRELWTATSNDGGKTWSQPRDSGLLGSTPWVVTTSDGLLVAVYARRASHKGGGEFAHTGIFAGVSRDHGHTWDTGHQVMLFDGGAEPVDGYPAAIALPDGSVYAVFSGPGCSFIGGVRFHPRSRDFGQKQPT